MSVNGWFPEINGRGEVVSGAGEIYLGDVFVAAGHGPKWVDDDTIVFKDASDRTVLYDVVLQENVAWPAPERPKYSDFAAGGGFWLGIRKGAATLIDVYKRTTRIDQLIECGPMAVAPNGRYVYADNYQLPAHTLWIKERGALSAVPLYAGPTGTLSISDRACCWQVATGPHTRDIYGLRLGASAIENWSFLPWEDAVVCDGPDGPWVLSVTQNGLILRPAGEHLGYQWTGDYRNPAIRFLNGVFRIASSNGHGEPRPLTVDPASPRVALQAPVTPPPPPPPEPIGPRSAPRVDARVYDLVDYILGDPSTWPRKGPTHPMHQALDPMSPDGRGRLFHFVKFGDIVPSGEAYETWGYDAHWLYHLEDASSHPYSFADTRWFPRHMPIGEAHAFDTGEHQTTFKERVTCQVERHEPFRRRMWVEAVYPAFYCGPDLGEREVMVIAYDPTAGIHGPTRHIELGYYAKGAGSIRWDSFQSDLLYPPAATTAQFASVRPSMRSDFYLLGGPALRPKLTGCVPQQLPSAPPLPIPVPTEEDSMIAFGAPLLGFHTGDIHDNGDGTVSVQKANGKWHCVTPDGSVEERDEPGGPWESFKRTATSLVAIREHRTYVLPLVNLE